MKKDDINTEDELRPEYDLKSLKLRKVGPERKSFGGPTVRIETDVAQVFPDSESVNEALRFLIRITKRNAPSFFGLSEDIGGAEPKAAPDEKNVCLTSPDSCLI
jgi:hypothetical protein